MTITFFMKPHYPKKVRAEMQFRAKRAKRRKRVYKILRTTEYLAEAEEINYFDEAQFESYKSEQRRAVERQRREDEDVFLLALMEAA